MSFDLCRKTDRGTLTDLSAQNEGLDKNILGSGTSNLKQHQGKYTNFANDTSVRATFEGKRNVFTVTVPEQGDLLTGATLVITSLKKLEDMYSDCCWTNQFIKSVEVRINGQCVQRLEKERLHVPFTGLNSPSTQQQRDAFRTITSTDNGPFYIPLNLFFSKKGNGYPLIDSQYPLEIRVEMFPIANAKIHHRENGWEGENLTSWTEDTTFTLLTTQKFLTEAERATLSGSTREMMILQRNYQDVALNKNDSTMRIKLDSNLPLRSLSFMSERVQNSSIIRYFINGHVRFEHYGKFLKNYHLLQGHDNPSTGIGNNEDVFLYHFGEPSADGVYGRSNLSQLDAPTIEIRDLAADDGREGILKLTMESYNLLVWKGGKSYLVLHKSR
jgi:hypothetical protein